jgi:peptidoglycan/xylan/chitin deacetylase (PgdA/CDA1 family)
MLILQLPNNCHAERQYIAAVMLGDFLGLEFQVEFREIDVVNLSLAGSPQSVILSDHFFAQAHAAWLSLQSLPRLPLSQFDLEQLPFDVVAVQRFLPVIYGDNSGDTKLFRQDGDEITLRLDIFGSAFFMLTLYEEAVKPDRDRLDRFPSTATLAAQANFLDRPIVNEYLEVLWGCLHHLWPQLQRRSRQFQVRVSHDVDEPFRFAFTGVKRLARRCAGDVLRRRSVRALGSSLSSWAEVKLLGRSDRDPCNNFDRIMDVSEEYNLQSAFYFITDHSAGAIDGVYEMRHPLIRQLLRRIHERGHEIGLHTSYNTYCNPQQTAKEFAILKQACAAEGIEQEIWGGRQHYLRWQTPTTFRNWADAGLDYDSTLSYADCIGFRCGTCYEFPVFDVQQRQALKLRERPLCVMEVTVIGASYMGLEIIGNAALQAMVTIKRRCRLFGGNFTILWHNTSLNTEIEWHLYQEILGS